uniref:Tripeptidyl-peptidase 2 n=1 Tax=Hirondellea gigas TaxID=1518452 RepID=A0A2P2I7P3_9CRUS
MAVSVDTTRDIPVSSLLPRKETGIVSFLNQYPKYDGSGVIIAIFDSGVDPAASGLQSIGDGVVKVIDRLDASGAGDVDTSTLGRLSADGTLTSITGKTLHVPSNWTNPTGEYHIGVKTAYSLYPTKLKDRIVKERRERLFDPQHKKMQEAAMRKLQVEKQRSSSSSTNTNVSPTEENENSICEGSNAASTAGNNNNNSQTAASEQSSSSGVLCDGDNNSVADCDPAARSAATANNGCASSNPTLSELPSSEYSSFLEKQQKEEAEAEVALLSTVTKKYQDLGPAYDCVVYHDGKCWRACIDTSECGDLSLGVHLGEYRITHEWSALTDKDGFTVTINVHNDGNLLEIVGMCSSHGTHVASIASAYFPDDPERNGVAPKAQIVSVTIGDNRVHGMETGTALSRAMAWVMENPFYKVDIINMSYGEHSHTSLNGRLGELASEVVNKHGVLWLASASNHGPGLSTVGSPPDFYSDCIMGIAAYISPEMMRAEYSIMDKLPGTAYTWSSRGPTSDGGRGVSLCAPGGAITSMPVFTNKTSQLLNGTSMASPHAAGCAALLLSALKQEGYCHNPYTIRRALQNTAKELDIESFGQGHGLIQVGKAFDYLMRHGTKLSPVSVMPPEDSMRFVVECGSKGLKGIYLRNWLGNRSMDISVSVEPVQFDDTRADDNVKRSLNLDLVLTCDATWVNCPEYLHMSYTLRSFMIRVNPHSLERGRVYQTTVKGYVASAPEKGPLFEVPITVMMPILELEHGYLYKSAPEVYKAGCVKRVFLRVPEGATWATLSIKSGNSDQNQRITLHAVQLFPQSSVLTYDHYKTFSCMFPHETSNTTFTVSPGLTLEVCVARWWAALHDTTVDFTVSFHGIKPYSDSLNMYSSNSVQRLDVVAKLRNEELWPQATLKHHVQSLPPYDSHIEVLGGLRDTVPNSRPIYQLVLSYTFSLIKGGDVQPKCALLTDYLYESAVESQLWMLFDSNKRILGSGDAYSNKYSVKLDKGEYIIRQHIRHEKTELLEKLQEMPMTLLTKLNQEVKLETFSTYYNAVTSSKKMSTYLLQSGEILPLFFSIPNLQDKAFKNLNLSPGHFLTGTLTFAKEEQARRMDVYPLRIVITEAIGGKKRTPNFIECEAQRKEPKTQADYTDALRDLQVNWLTKVDSEASAKLYEDVCRQHNAFLQAHVARLHAIDSYYNGTNASTLCTYKATASSSSTSSSTSSAAAAKPLEPTNSDQQSSTDSNSDLVLVEPEPTSSVVAADASSKEAWLQWKNSIVEVASSLLKCVDLPALLAYLGTKMDVRADAAKFKTQMDRQKIALVDAYAKQGLAIAHPYVPSILSPNNNSTLNVNPECPVPYDDVVVPPSPPDAILNELDAIATTVLKLVDSNDLKVVSFFINYYQVRRLYATAARLLHKQLDDKYSKDGALRLATLFRLLGHHQMVAEIIRGLPSRFPDRFVLF